MCTRAFVIAFVVAAADLVMSPTQAHACKSIDNRPHTIDPQAQLTDTSPPGAAVASVHSIRRGKGAEHDGCSQSASSCDDVGMVVVAVTATDDQTGADSLGYRIELLSGRLPSGLSLPATPVRPATSSGLSFGWNDGRSDDQEALAFVLAIRAVDLAGNEGPATSVEVRDPGSGGCSVAGRGIGAWRAPLACALLVLAGLLRRRRQQR